MRKKSSLERRHRTSGPSHLGKAGEFRSKHTSFLLRSWQLSCVHPPSWQDLAKQCKKTIPLDTSGFCSGSQQPQPVVSFLLSVSSDTLSTSSRSRPPSTKPIELHEGEAFGSQAQRMRPIPDTNGCSTPPWDLLMGFSCFQQEGLAQGLNVKVGV